MRKLPPDPDELNAARALKARCALNEFIKQTRCYPDEAMRELLAGLMHMRDRENAEPFGVEVANARALYAAQTRE